MDALRIRDDPICLVIALGEILCKPGSDYFFFLSSLNADRKSQ